MNIQLILENILKQVLYFLTSLEENLLKWNKMRATKILQLLLECHLKPLQIALKMQNNHT